VRCARLQACAPLPQVIEADDEQSVARAAELVDEVINPLSLLDQALLKQAKEHGTRHIISIPDSAAALQRLHTRTHSVDA
jgi:hypothetical protein